MSILQIENLSVRAWGAQLLQHISLQVDAGELVAIIGPNGAGKTTLMRTFLLDQSHHYRIEGEVNVCGHQVVGATISEQANTWQDNERPRHIAMLPQQSLLNFPFTVEEVVRLSRIPHSTGTVMDNDIIDQALAALDITHLKTRLYTQLSGGEKQRVQLARVMSQIWRSDDAQQRLLLLDEPSSSLDLGHQQQLMSALRRFANEGVAIVMVAHDINLVAQYADRVLALSCGRLIAQGTPQQVITAPLMQTLYQVDVGILPHPVSGKPVITY